jgi:hypothetical protein
MALEGLIDKDLVDLTLGKRVVATLLAHVDQAGILADPAEEFLVGQVVIDDDIGLLEALDPAQRNEPRVPGACAYDVDFTFFTQSKPLCMDSSFRADHSRASGFRIPASGLMEKDFF